jgi:mannose-6-phosphate isomerase-like protein (cupin superfamily)
MSPITTGRTLDGQGEPIEGTGFEVEPGSDLAERIAARTGPITSHPTRPVWGIPLEAPDNAIRTLSVFGPGYTGPPEHYHLQSEEGFDVREGAVTFTLDGTDRVVGAGERTTVDTGVRHTFRNAGDERAIVLTEIHSPGRLRQVLPTLGGLAHDDTMDTDDTLQQAMIARRLEGNTVFTEQERPVASAVTDALAPVARLAGYEGAYGKYSQESFWRRHVEQPDSGL